MRSIRAKRLAATQGLMGNLSRVVVGRTSRNRTFTLIAITLQRVLTATSSRTSSNPQPWPKYPSVADKAHHMRLATDMPVLLDLSLQQGTPIQVYTQFCVMAVSARA